MQSLPNAFDQAEWKAALSETAPAHAPTSVLVHAGAACAYLWSKTPICRLVQRVLLADDAEALQRLMPFVRCLNHFILDDKGLLKRITVRTHTRTSALHCFWSCRPPPGCMLHTLTYESRHRHCSSFVVVCRPDVADEQGTGAHARARREVPAWDVRRNVQEEKYARSFCFLPRFSLRSYVVHEGEHSMASC